MRAAVVRRAQTLHDRQRRELTGILAHGRCECPAEGDRPVDTDTQDDAITGRPPDTTGRAPDTRGVRQHSNSLHAGLQAPDLPSASVVRPVVFARSVQSSNARKDVEVGRRPVPRDHRCALRGPLSPGAQLQGELVTRHKPADCAQAAPRPPEGGVTRIRPGRTSHRPLCKDCMDLGCRLPSM